MLSITPLWKNIFPISEKHRLSVRLAIFSIAYVIFIGIGRLLSIHSSGIVAYWPASGLMLGALLLADKREWIVHLVLAVAIRVAFSALTGGSMVVGLLLGSSTAIEAVVAAIILRTIFPTTRDFSTVPETLALISLGAIGATLIGATIGSYVISGEGYGEQFWQHWRRYWVGDMLGILLVTPLVLAWNALPPRENSSVSAGRIIEGTVLFLFTVTLSTLIYSGTVTWLYTDFFYLIPLLIWAALRFGPRGVSANGFALAGVSIWFFVSTPEIAGMQTGVEHRAIGLQLFLGITIATILILVAVLSDRQKSLQRLIESERYLQSAFATIPDSVALTDAASGRYRDVNESFCQNTGYHRDDLIGKTSIELGIWVEEDDRLRMVNEIATRGKASLLESRFRRKDGTVLVGLMSACIIQIENRPVIFSITTDISARKTIEENLARSLREKEVLLKEIHHRVKNNLQIISSLLNLQTAHTHDAHTVGLFRESQSRIRSMALIHEHLYRSPSLASIDFAEYVNALTGSLMRSQIRSLGRVHLEIDIPGISLDIDTAIPCGLIINELVTNSLKYAFPDDRDGRILIKMRREDHTLTLDVQDNGIGLPGDIDVAQAKSLGLELVATLADQIGARLTVTNTDGAGFHFSWTSV